MTKATRKLIDAEEAVRAVRDATRPHTRASENSDVYAHVERGGTLAIAALRALPGVEEVVVARGRYRYDVGVVEEPSGAAFILGLGEPGVLPPFDGQRVEVVVRRVREER